MSCEIISALPKDIALQMKATNVWRDDCPVPLERLALIRIQYIDFAGCEHDDGELIVLDAVAEHVADVFSTLHTKRFPVNKIRLMHHYSGDDDLSMADNNTSCFNYRTIQGSSLISMHSYGLAIDINPLQNPMIYTGADSDSMTVHPENGREFLNRNEHRTGMVEDIVSVFAEHGFDVWGGKWSTPIDYHHFQPPREVAEPLLTMSKDDARKFFADSIQSRRL